jgi:hypothetical protein
MYFLDLENGRRLGLGDMEIRRWEKEKGIGRRLTHQQAQNSEPISGISSEGYKGPGQVQSPPKKA